MSSDKQDKAVLRILGPSAEGSRSFIIVCPSSFTAIESALSIEALVREVCRLSIWFIWYPRLSVGRRPTLTNYDTGTAALRPREKGSSWNQEGKGRLW